MSETITTRVQILLDETKELNKKFERQISYLETLPQIFKQSNLFLDEFKQKIYKSQKNLEENLCIKIDDLVELLKLLYTKDKYLTLDDLRSFFKEGEDSEIHKHILTYIHKHIFLF